MRFCALFLAASCLSAQAPARLDPARAPRVGVGVTETRLSLQEAVERAVRGNLEIEIEKAVRATAQENIRAAKGYLDPIIRFAPSVEARNTPTGSTLASETGTVTEHLAGANLGYRQRFNWQGFSFRADFENTRTSTNNPFTSLNPYVAPRFVLGFTLPLLRGRETDPERTELIIRQKQADISGSELELRVIDIVSRVEQAYYDLVAALADVTVADESVALAQEQLDRTRRLIDAGSLAQVELAAAEAELERRKDTFFSSLNTVTQAENNLKLLLAGGRDEEIWRDAIVPTDTGRAPRPATIGESVAALVDSAIERRVELRPIEIRKEINEAQRSLALDQKKPALALQAGYVASGLAGTALSTSNPFADLNRALIERLNVLSVNQGLPPLPPVNFGGGVPESLVGGYGTSLSNMFGGRYNSFQGGLTLDWNTRNRTAESNLAQTAIAERRLALERRRTEQAIEAQVRNALQTVQTAEQRIAAAEASARAAKEKLDSEVRLFQTGESTNFLVLTRQNEFSDSRRRAVIATLEYNKSVARLEAALGTTLDRYQIRIE